MERETLALAVGFAITFTSLASLIMSYARNRAERKVWAEYKKVRAERENLLITQIVALQEILIRQERDRANRAAKYAHWHLMAGPGESKSAEALMDVDAILDEAATIQRFAKDEKSLRDVKRRLVMENVRLTLDPDVAEGEGIKDPFVSH
jgi:hypothetical protein